MNEETKEPEADEPEEMEEWEIEIDPDPSVLNEYISSAYFALSALDDIDYQMENDEMKKRIKRIKRKSIAIIDHSIKELYNFIFDDGDQV